MAAAGPLAAVVGAQRSHQSGQAVAVVADGSGEVGKLSLSVKALSAMRFASARLSICDMPAATGERLGLEVCVHSASLNADAMLRLKDLLRERKLKVGHEATLE